MMGISLGESQDLSNPGEKSRFEYDQRPLSLSEARTCSTSLQQAGCPFQPSSAVGIKSWWWHCELRELYKRHAMRGPAQYSSCTRRLSGESTRLEGARGLAYVVQMGEGERA